MSHSPGQAVADCARSALRMGAVAVLLASGCLLDFSGLAGGAAPEPASDGGADVDAPFQDRLAEAETASGNDAADDAVTADTAPDGPEAGCAALECGDCQPCPPQGCEPTVLATGPAFADGPRALAVTPEALLWVNEGSGQVVRLASNETTPLVIAHADGPTAIAAHQDVVVWAERDGLFTCKDSNCDATRQQIAPSLYPGSIQGLVLSGTKAYWSDRGTGTTTDGAIRWCDVSSCGSPHDVTTTGFRPFGVALAGGYLLWTNQGDGYATGSVYVADSVGGNVRDVAQSEPLPTGLAADDTYVYFSRMTAAGRVLRCAYLDGFCETPVDIAPSAGDLARPFAVQIAGARVWFATSDDGAIRSCALPGCGTGQPVTHLTGRTGLRAMAVGTSCVFFADGEGGGTVGKMAR